MFVTDLIIFWLLWRTKVFTSYSFPKSLTPFAKSPDVTPVAQKITSPLIMSSILRGNVKFPFSISSKERKYLKFNKIDERLFSAYLRFEVLDKPGVLSNITNIFSKNKVSIKRLLQNPDKNKQGASIIIVTHKSKNKFLTKILGEVTKKKYIKRKPKLIRIDEV